MTSRFDDMSEELFQILKGSGKTLSLFDANGQKVYEPKKARRFFAEPDKMMMSIDEDGSNSEIKLYLSQSSNLEKLNRIINTLRQVSTRYNVLFNVRKYGKDLTPKDFAFAVEPVAEALMYGSTKSSYQRIGNAKLVVRHTAPVREGIIGGRGRNILSLFVETAQGERFRFPLIHLSGSRAWARHLAEGGLPYDNVGNYIIEQAGNHKKLALMSRHIYYGRNNLAEGCLDVRSIVRERMSDIKYELGKLARERGYRHVVEDFMTKEQIVEGSNLDLQAECDRLSELLNIDSNHALAECIKPVALLTMGEKKMTENSKFGKLVTLEDLTSIDELVESLINEYGHEEGVHWNRANNGVMFLLPEAFEQCVGHLDVMESPYQIHEEPIDKFVAYAQKWLNTRLASRNGYGNDADKNDQRPQDAVTLANGLKGLIRGHVEQPTGSTPIKSEPATFNNANAELTFKIGELLDKGHLTNDLLFNYLSSLSEKLRDNQPLSSNERFFAEKAANIVQPETEAVQEDGLPGYDDWKTTDPNDRHSAASEQAYEQIAGNFDVADFLADTGSDFDWQGHATLGTDDKTYSPDYIKSSLNGYLERLARDEYGVDLDATSLTDALYAHSVAPMLQKAGYVLADAQAPAMAAEGEMTEGDYSEMFPHQDPDDFVGTPWDNSPDPEDNDIQNDYEIGNQVSTVKGPGKIVDTDLDHSGQLTVELMHGGVEQFSPDELEKVERPGMEEMRTLEAWFETFDPISFLSVVSEAEENETEEELEEAKAHPWIGRTVRTPEGPGEVTYVDKEPTFSRMVPYRTMVSVKLADGTAKTFRKEMVSPIKPKVAPAPVEEADDDFGAPEFIDHLKNRHAGKGAFEESPEGALEYIRNETTYGDMDFNPTDWEMIPEHNNSWLAMNHKLKVALIVYGSGDFEEVDNYDEAKNKFSNLGENLSPISGIESLPCGGCGSCPACRRMMMDLANNKTHAPNDMEENLSPISGNTAPQCGGCGMCDDCGGIEGDISSAGMNNPNQDPNMSQSGLGDESPDNIILPGDIGDAFNAEVSFNGPGSGIHPAGLDDKEAEALNKLRRMAGLM